MTKSSPSFYFLKLLAHVWKRVYFVHESAPTTTSVLVLKRQLQKTKTNDQRSVESKKNKHRAKAGKRDETHKTSCRWHADDVYIILLLLYQDSASAVHKPQDLTVMAIYCCKRIGKSHMLVYDDKDKVQSLDKCNNEHNIILLLCVS